MTMRKSGFLKKLGPWFLFGFVGLTFFSSQSVAEPLTIGFQNLPKDLDYLNHTSPAARFVRAAVTETLTEAHTPRSSFDPPYRLQLSDNIFSTGDFSAWGFRLRPDAAFSSGRKVRPDDVRYSIERCRTEGQFPELERVVTEDETLFAGRRGTWVGFYFLTSKKSEEASRRFPVDLTNCPIYEQASSDLFGGALGHGTNIVSSGKYRVQSFVNGKQILLERIYSFRESSTGSEALLLRGFSDPARGLTALRLGTIAALFVEDDDVLAKAQEDETLAIDRCLSATVIRRKSLTLPCNPELDVGAIRYVT